MRAPEMKTQSPSGSRGRAGVRISNLPPWLSLLCMVICIKEGPAMQISVSSTLTVITTANSGSGWRSTSRTADTASPASSSARSRPMRRSCNSLQANGRSSRSSATIRPRRASPRGTPSDAQFRGVEGPQAAGNGHQGAAGARESAGSDEAGVGSCKKPTPRG